MLHQARGHLPDTDLVVGDLHRLPLPEDFADLVVTGIALTHIAGPVPEVTREIGSWQDWPWTLLGLVPEATRAAWDSPAVAVWHFQLSSAT